MNVLLGAVVDGDALVKVLWVSIAAGVGVTAIFGIAIVGVARAADASREGRRVETFAYGALGTAALLLVAAAIVLGVFLMAAK